MDQRSELPVSCYIDWIVLTLGLNRVEVHQVTFFNYNWNFHLYMMCSVLVLLIIMSCLTSNKIMTIKKT